MKVFISGMVLVVMVLLNTVSAHGPGSIHVTIKHDRDFEKQLINLERLLKKEPARLQYLDELAGLYISQGRKTSNEQYFLLAEKVLLPVVSSKYVNNSLLLKWADVLQRTHRFHASSEVLGDLLKSDPGNTQARLMRAVIAQVSGDYKQAGNDCLHLVGKTELLLAVTCLSQVKGMTGSLPAAIIVMERALKPVSNHTHEPLTESRLWAMTVLSEMYLRAGRTMEARSMIERLLVEKPADYYLISMLADSLLEQKMFRQVVDLVGEKTTSNKLLLRKVIAEIGLGKGHPSGMKMLRARVHKLLHSKDDSNAGLLARYYLDVKKDKKRALTQARRNWKTQRNAEDILLLQRCLERGVGKNSQHELQDWIVKFNYQDVRLRT